METLPDDIENLVTLRTLRLGLCPILDGTAMERIMKLQNCSYISIHLSAKLIKWWKEIQNKEEYPILVETMRDDACFMLQIMSLATSLFTSFNWYHSIN